MKKTLLLAVIVFLSNLSYGQSFAGSALGLLINNTSGCEVYVALTGRVTSISGSVCGDAVTTTFHLMPTPGPGNTYYTPSWDATNMSYTGSGSFGPTSVVSFEKASFQFGNCPCGGSGGDMGPGCGASGPSWSNACINGTFTIPGSPFLAPVIITF